MTTDGAQDWRFHATTLNRRWSNASLMHHRGFDGHIVSMQQSGSHWIKNLLGHALMEIYDLPPMAHIQDDSIIGHVKSPPLYKNIPQIVHSHGYPHALTLQLPFLHYPKYLVLVRELKDSLVSHYERFKGDYGTPDFSTYLRSDLRKKKYYSDIYSRMRFMNEWGRVIDRAPRKVLSLRYEDMKARPESALRDVCAFFGITGATAEVIARAVTASTREKMAEKQNPAVTTTVVRTNHQPLESYFTPENQKFFDEACRRFLTHDFGYGYPLVEKKARACPV